MMTKDANTIALLITFIRPHFRPSQASGICEILKKIMEHFFMKISSTYSR